jgi:excisionase family DNA binding protein
MPATPSPDLTRYAYSIDEVVKLTGLGRTLIYQAIQRGQLVAVKCGRRTIVLHEHLQAFLQSLPRRS